MGLIKVTVYLTIVVMLAAIVIQKYTPDNKIPESYRDDHWWGRPTELLKVKDGQRFPKDSKELRKFKVHVDDSILTDLQERLNRTRFIEPLPESNFEYGFNGDYLRQVIGYWQNDYDWKKHEAELNKYDQFKTQIEGLDVHFIHVKPAKGAKTVIPVLLVHGWPGSVYEFYKLIPLLSKVENGVALELVIPSIPGYGFSEVPHQKGFNAIHAGRVFVKLMERLGHKKFVYQGGDWGAVIGRFMATVFPDKLIGIHLNMLTVIHFNLCNSFKMIVGAFLPNLIYDNPDVDVKKVYPLLPKIFHLLEESGYAHIQATKPDTVGTALLNSPAGLAAYILEKFSTWVNRDFVTRPEGGLTEKFSLDQLLTNVMIYWVSDNLASSLRFYKENIAGIEQKYHYLPISAQVPVGVTAFPNEIELVTPPKTLAKATYPNIIQYTDMPRGGHFAAFEEPELLAADVKAFIGKLVNLSSKTL